MQAEFDFGTIQNALIAYEHRHGEAASVGEVMALLADRHFASENKTSVQPDFSEWDMTDAHALMEIFSHVTLEPQRVKSDFSYWVSDRVFRVPVAYDIFVFMHFSSHKIELRKKDVIEFCYVLDGSAKLFQEKESQVLHTGDFALIGPENAHDIVAENGSAVLGIQIPCHRFSRYCFGFMQNNNVLVHILSQLLYGSRANYYVVYAAPDDEIKRAIRALLMEFRQSEPYSTAICTHLLEVLLYKILQSCEVSAEVLPHRSAELVFSTAMNLIYQQRNLSLKELSRRLCYSEGYLSRLIHRKMGQTFNEVVSEVRHERAVQLLENTDLPMSDVAEYAGYSSQNQFSRAFREKTGFTPTQFRRERSSNA